MPPHLEIRYLSGHDVDRLAIGPDLILDATERALAAQGRGEVVLEPREHLVPDPAFNGHFNLLRAYVAPLGVAGVKVVGDYHGNYKLGLPSELALLTLYDPRTGVVVTRRPGKPHPMQGQAGPFAGCPPRSRSAAQMDGCSRQNPAYRPASERAPGDGSPL